MSKTRIVVVTGTSRGIGRGLAAYFLKQGDVVCGCSRKPATLRHKNYRHSLLDVADEKAVVAMIRGVVAEYGRVDVLLNNAGIAAMNHALLTPGSVARAIFATNFHGTFLFCREAAKAMLRRKTGRIVNFATVATPLLVFWISNVLFAGLAALGMMSKSPVWLLSSPAPERVIL